MKKFKTTCVDCLSTRCIIKQSCSNVVLTKLDEYKITNRYVKNQIVFHEHNVSRDIFFVKKGIVKVFKNGAFNKDQTIRFSLSGDILGYEGFTAKNVYSVSSMVLVDTEICEFSKEYFFSLLVKEHQLAIKLISLLADGLSQEETKLRDMALFNVREKVAKALLICAEKLGLNDVNEINYFEILSRQDVADCVGLRSNQVTKVLSEFRKEGLLEIKGKKVKLLDRESLEELVSY